MALRIIDRSLVRELLPMDGCIRLMEDAMRATARGETIQPPRWILGLPGGEGRGFGMMPGVMAKPDCFGAKVTAVYPENHARGLQSHQGLILLFDTEHGAPVAIVHGGEVTAIRTAAASGLATRLLARADADDLAILGYGEQAMQHLRAMAIVRPPKRVRVWGRSPERAEAFARQNQAFAGVPIEVMRSAEAAVKDASLICTVSAAAEPILAGRWVAQGAHLNVVGSSVAAAREIDSDAVVQARFFVDYKPSTLLQGGEFLAAKREGRVTDDHILGEIGAVLLGLLQGRRSETDITLYKSLGIAAEDLVCAHHLFTTAQQRGLGTDASF
ncbi:ornithine cyclodeaminase family protein [Labrys monachus]|uniref:Ornithine cyclodeaminase n=1 Tax=Labrys monachus TaxID=217067 RepID=A0ABU0F8D5_9HYPH|nr:ornithine cyclodeaminase family protein [Labrys monachus]MDQ0390801.1 ornithine cyclodeaminase [Labrys monachus]